MKINRVITTAHDVQIEIELPGQNNVTVLVVPQPDGTWLFCFSGIGSQRVIPFQRASNQAEVRFEELPCKRPRQVTFDDASLYGAAMSASFALEGVKDNRATNMMLAQNLLDNRERYLEVRDVLMTKMGWHEIAILDRHHEEKPMKDKATLLAWYLFYRQDQQQLNSPHDIQGWLDDFDQLSEGDVCALLQDQYIQFVQELRATVQTPPAAPTNRVMLINDSDGHASAIAFTVENLKSCLLQLHITGRLEGDAGEAKRLHNDPNSTAEQILEFIEENGPTGRSGGGQLYFTEIRDWPKKWRPWD